MRDCDFCKGFYKSITLTRNPDNYATICNVCVKLVFLQIDAFVHAELEYLSWFRTGNNTTHGIQEEK